MFVDDCGGFRRREPDELNQSAAVCVLSLMREVGDGLTTDRFIDKEKLMMEPLCLGLSNHSQPTGL